MKLNKYTIKECTYNDSTVTYREYSNITYVKNPTHDMQKMNIYVPTAYYEGKTINGYNKDNAPIFIPNSVGGYRYGDIQTPDTDNRHYTISAALNHGYVVVSPFIRGRGVEGGLAPAFIVDYKAAVRFIRSLKDELPGDVQKIITNGTSAGGALSALIGMTGNHIDYQKYLDEIGAYDEDDSIYGASCYCPITNLDHADMAYEWQFSGVYSVHRKNMKNEGGRPTFSMVDEDMSDKEIQVSKDLEKLFPAYVNSLNLKDSNGNPLTLDNNGNGSFKEYVKSLVIDAGNKTHAQNISWAIYKDDKIVDIDYLAYCKDITRMKNAPAFDNLELHSPENEEFHNQHFTDYSYQHSLVNGAKTKEEYIKLMNPMYYLDDNKATKTKYWRIRHGSVDRDTSLSISAILALSLMNRGFDVDYASPWNTPHSGDYDLNELFAWIDNICK